MKIAEKCHNNNNNKRNDNSDNPLTSRRTDEGKKSRDMALNRPRLARTRRLLEFW